WSLQHACCHQESAVTTALNGQLRGSRVLVVNEVFSSGDKVVKHVLLLLLDALLVPFDTVFATATNIGQSKHSLDVLNKEDVLHREVRLQADVEPSISVEQCGIVAIELHITVGNNKHGDACAILALVEYLTCFNIARVNADTGLIEDARLVGL